MYGSIKDELLATLAEIDAAGLYKRERQLTTAQSAHVGVGGGSPAVLNFCANNYLGLADHPDVVAAAKAALDEWGFGMASVRFICGTQTQHTLLEDRLSAFLGTEATILYSSCFDANGGVFEVLFGEGDAIISDELNHASIIDGVRLAKAARYRYRNADMADLRVQLEAARAAGARRVVIVTDGVFSMDGSYAPLPQICDLAEEYAAMVLVDDSHAVGFVGEGGRGTPELFGVADRVDIVTGTLGKALGGASGGYVSSHREVVDLLRQRSRPYLFSNSVAPAVVARSLAALDLGASSGFWKDWGVTASLISCRPADGHHACDYRIAHQHGLEASFRSDGAGSEVRRVVVTKQSGDDLVFLITAATAIKAVAPELGPEERETLVKELFRAAIPDGSAEKSGSGWSIRIGRIVFGSAWMVEGRVTD